MTCLEGLPEQSLFSLKTAAQLGLQKRIWTNYKVSGQGHLDSRGQSGDV